MINNELEIVKFSSLLHDIGKFYQRADNVRSGSKMYDSKYDKLTADDYGQNGAHGKWSADFVRGSYGDEIEDLVLHHHLPSKSINPKLCGIVQKADHHSSAERIASDEKQEVLDTPLISIFSRIALNNSETDEYYIPLEKLDLNDSLYPKETTNQAMDGWNLKPDYERLWNEFINEFKLIDAENFDTVLALLKKYTSTIPSATYLSESDVSLYDHAKTTAALATCRYLFDRDSENKLTKNDDQECYLVVTGDISGIQKFIYRISSPQDAQSGMSKRLRGRSLYITLLAESIVGHLINKLNLNSSNILFCGGGRFTIIAPNTSKTIDVIEEFKEKINLFFIENFNSELYLSLVYEEASGVDKDKEKLDLKNFGKILQELNSKHFEDKKHKFSQNLEDVFKIEDVSYDDLCVVCGKGISGYKDDDKKICAECAAHEELGQAVANSRYMVKYENDGEIEGSNFFIDLLNIGYIFKKSKKDVIKLVNKYPEISFTVYILNSTDFTYLIDEVTSDNVSFDFKFLGNNVPNIKGQPLYFEHLAKISKGANKLGVLKMDVDNLGKIFSNGFNHLNKDNNFSSISRVSSLSFYLDLFFSGLINEILDEFKVFIAPCDDCADKFDEIELEFERDEDTIIKKSVYRPKDGAEICDKCIENAVSTIYVNYSGGDDLLVVGPYDDIIKFSESFQSKFKKWTANNDSINISAGINISGAKFPIGKAAILADNNLEKSKECGRNKITLFNEILSWKSNGLQKGFYDLLDFAEELESYAESKKVSKSIVYSLLKIWESRSNVKSIEVNNEKDWHNNVNEKISKKAYVPLLKYKLRLISDRTLRNELDKKTMKFMPWIKVPVSWVSLRLR
ncbi:hypothetical protein MBBWO_09710 [Methanobrevibacter woesei]|uniref:CRISPR system single-strand-specific deoxyribonuclease Cas10/Csm1 (subtype III-A) n=1 Tax=Methanobrevibacter woesei TaxID=190976 RepID=A0A2U1S7L5_9EURY|nr:type III-A CRISPR-associated protein Cas10/Csm1 [Methanobrevibacter woesei]PWB86117.1 hypothetical protein MBBWO_09710 [Methanobrevibacter woesei]